MSSQPSVEEVLEYMAPSALLFELIPPPSDASGEELQFRESKLRELFRTADVRGLNLPEVQEESAKDQKGTRRSEFQTRWSPRNYARELNGSFDTTFMINRVIVQLPPKQQEQWLLKTYHEYGIRFLVLVGGESSDQSYPGPSVPEGNRLIKEHLNRGESLHAPGPVQATDFLVGNIAIATRRRTEFDEPERMVRKIRSGADYFTTQIVAEPDSPCQLLEDLAEELESEAINPPFIFWSFAPIASQKDVDFMRYLGVQIPEEVESRVLNHSDPTGESIKWARSIWEELVRTAEELPIRIPLGINVSFMGMRNFDNAIRLAETLQEVSFLPRNP